MRAFSLLLSAADLDCTSIATNHGEALVTACELLDWYRLVDIPRTSGDTLRLYAALQDLSGDIARELLLCVPPGGDIFSGIKALPDGSVSSYSLHEL